MRGPTGRQRDVLQGRVRRTLRERVAHREGHRRVGSGAGAERAGHLRVEGSVWEEALGGRVLLVGMVGGRDGGRVIEMEGGGEK